MALIGAIVSGQGDGVESIIDGNVLDGLAGAVQISFSQMR